MARTIPSSNIPNPDDATNGVIAGVSVTLFRTASGVNMYRVSYPNDPDGDFEAPFTSIASGDRTKGRDFALACLAVYKTARGYV